MNVAPKELSAQMVFAERLNATLKVPQLKNALVQIATVISEKTVAELDAVLTD